ncbi:uncharacterized protein LOC129596288 [Paramacrobiotus metropolitanus]|uniref:uncharacterized protein LOC129596288 n=1 Tax=Paramacrobiotus metropolitanus TaxID=2943436 RepID=UPI0024459DA3|nr:uncharacterized protein LOC129596288 [Paramacrobiotus metropolitanus]
MDTRQQLQYLDAMLNFPPEQSAWECNAGNTVLVNHGDDNWCLAYIQDIHEGSFLLNYITDRTTTRWVHSKYVWPHLLIDCQPADNPVYVAVRNEFSGRFVFRSARLVAVHQRENDDFQLYHVRLDIAGDDGQLTTLCRVVHHFQLVERLPGGDEPSFADRIALPKYAKFQMHYPAPGPDDVFGWDYQRCTMYRGAFWNVITGLCRYYLQISTTGTRFILWQTRDNGREIQERADSYGRGFFRYSKRTHNPSERNEQLEVVFSGDACLTEETEFCITDLANEVFTMIFQELDAQSQVRLKRVCRLWYAVSECFADTNVHITLNVENFHTFPHSWHRNHYRFAVLLDKVLHKRIKVVSLVVNADPRVSITDHVDLVISMMQLRNIQNYMIRAKNRKITIPVNCVPGEIASSIFAGFREEAGTVGEIQCLQCTPTDADRQKLMADTSTVYRDGLRLLQTLSTRITTGEELAEVAARYTLPISVQNVTKSYPQRTYLLRIPTSES